jgi:uncharacterized iron-regulated membrane protein
MPINPKSKINRIITWLHLWLGLISGIIVVIVSLTGCLFTFQKEITEWVHKKELFITPPPEHAPVLSVEVLTRKAEQVLGPGKPVTYITAYADPRRAWEFMAYKEGDPDAFTFPGEVACYASAFVNPYTGEVTGTIDYMHNFFVIVKYIHWSLYLSTKYGQPIVGWGTLIFVISLITGVVMWFPKRWNKAEKNKSFKVRWKGTWKRLNYDLHNVLGFYVVLIALILGLTGMVYSFSWFSNAVYATASLTTTPPPVPDFRSDSAAAITGMHPMDKALAAARANYPQAKRFLIEPPASPDAPLVVDAYNQHEVYYDVNTLYFDQYSARPLGTDAFANKNNGEKLIYMNYDIHVGAIGGLPGKIIAFLVSLVCASLPITGFIIWRGKKKKRAAPVRPASKRQLVRA